MTGLGTPNVGVMVDYLTRLLSGSARAGNVTDTVIAPTTFPSGGSFGTVLNVFTAGLGAPSALALNGTTLLVADYFTSGITSYTAGGFQGISSFNGGGNSTLSLTVDAARGVLYRVVGDRTSFAQYNLTNGALISNRNLSFIPRSIAVQPSTGNLYVTSSTSNSITILFINGSVGMLNNRALVAPYCVTFEPGGVLYVGDRAAGQYTFGALIAINTTSAATIWLIDNTGDGFLFDSVTSIAVDQFGYVMNIL